ncbi:hypothetical protein LINPERHAP2_LOCUS2569, partial [Linum perenne]
MGDGMIDVVIRHGGRMDFSGSEPKYVGGEENIVGFDTDYLSYRTIMAVAKDDLGYQIVHRIWWLPPKKTMANGLRELFGDNEILYGLMIDVNKVEDGQVVMFFEATKEVSGGWDNEDGNLGDDEGMNSDDDDGAENSVRPPHSPFAVVSDESDNSAQAYDDFIKQEPKRFCRAFLSTACKSDSVESNLCESFNNAITRFRDLQIIKLLEGIRSYIMVRIVEQHKAFAALKDSICPSILEQIEWTKIESRRCSIQPSLDDVLECTMRGRGFVVDLRQSHCTCGYWQLSGVPCVHAVAGLAFMRYDITDYVDQWYSVATAKKAYAKGIPPLTGREDWREVEGTQVLPPPYKVLPGRPKKNRRKEPGEIATRPSRTGVGTIMRKQGVTMHCSRCGQPDHNIRGCNMTPEEAASLPQVPPPKPIGRPRRQPVERPHPVQPNAQPAPPRKVRCKHCKHYGHNIRGCPVKRGVQLGAVDRNTPRTVVDREIRQAMRGVGVHVSPGTGNQYFA